MWAPSNEQRAITAAHLLPPGAPAKIRPSALGDTAAYHPSFGALPVRYETIARPDDDEAATADTIGIMCRMAREDSQAPAIRAAALEAAAAGDPIAGVHSWVRRHVTFRPDSEAAAALSGFTPDDTEVLIRPVDLLRMPQPAGDCDDYSMLTAAMLRALGVPVSYVTIAADPTAPDIYSHVYVLANHTTPVDSSHGPRPGWSAPAAGKSRTWEIDSPMLTPRTLGNDNMLWDVWGLNPDVAAGTNLGVDYPAASSGGGNWWDLAYIGANAGADIARMAATPTGYYQQTGPGGTITTRQAAGMPFSVPALSSGSSWLMVAGVGIVLVMLLARKG